MKILEIDENSIYIDKVHELYISAFPAEERTDFEDLKYHKFPGSKLLVALEEDEFIGFSFAATSKNILYIIYLAIDDKFRNKGLGTQLLNEICDFYPDKAKCLCVETPSAGEMAKRRIGFYERNGFVFTHIQFDCYGTDFYILCNGDFLEVEFKDLLLRCFPVSKDFKYVK